MRFGRLMCFWQSLRPHFLCRYCDRKFARSPPKPIASVVSGHSWKGKKRQICIEKSLRNCPLFDMKRLFGFDRLLTSDNFFGRTIPRRFSKEENRLFSFGTMTTKDRIGDYRLVRLSGLAGWKWFSQRKDIFCLLRLTFRSCGLKMHSDSEKRKKQKIKISPTTRKKRKPVSGLSGERFTGKFFRLLICSFLTEFSRTRQEIHKTCFETLILRVWILKIIR